MEVISIVNNKGGVGKTTTALNFGAELAERGYSVLLVDFDPQGNLTKVTGVNGNVAVEKMDHTVATALEELIEGQGDIEVMLPILNTGYSGRLDIVPCNIQLVDVELRLRDAIARETYLNRLLLPVRKSGEYDYCIIDTAPGVRVDFQNALVASDRILIILTPDILSTEGMATLIGVYNKIREFFNQALEIDGALINNYQTHTVFSRDMVSITKKVWEEIGVYETVIPKSVRVQESQAMHLSIRKYSPGNAAGEAFSCFVNEFLERRKPNAEIQQGTADAK